MYVQLTFACTQMYVWRNGGSLNGSETIKPSNGVMFVGYSNTICNQSGRLKIRPQRSNSGEEYVPCKR
jgi:hypothetical protein